LRALAILGPHASPELLHDFRLAEAKVFHVEHFSPETAADALLVFGGDGTVHRQLAAAVEAQVPLLPVPVGSGNDFAHALGIRGRQGALAAWRKFCAGAGNVEPVDVGVIHSEAGSPVTGSGKPETGTLFCCVAGVGLDSEANRRANAMPVWLRARGGYILGLLGALASYRPQRISVEQLDPATGEILVRISEPAMMVAFANAPSYGRGMRIAPRARLNDGRLDVCFVRQTGNLRLLRLFPRVFRGGHLGLPEIVYTHASRVRVESESALPVYADGECICPTPVEIGMRPAALRVIVP
jgi:diacylglycerol kinase (ATP)